MLSILLFNASRFNGCRYCARVLITALLIAGATTQQLTAQEITTVDDSSANTDNSQQEIPAYLKTPRAAFEHFVSAMTRAKSGHARALVEALEALDLSDVNPLVRAEKGSEIAWMLLSVLERAGLTEANDIPTQETGDVFTLGQFDSGEIKIAYSENLGWRFSANSIDNLQPILDETTATTRANNASDSAERYLPLSVRIRQIMPANLKRKTFALEQWQWIGILLTILLGFVLDKLVALLLRLGARSWKHRMPSSTYQDVDDAILRPLGLMAMALVWWAGLNLMGLPSNVLVVLLVSVKFLTCLSAVWSAYRLVDLLRAFLMDKAQTTQSKLDDALVPLLTKTVKVFVTVMGIIFIAENLDVDVTSLLAGLGLGGLAFALAAKDVAGNLFGSITVLLDQTFHVGDWVVIGDVEGTVEKIGFRSTRIRTFYNSLVSVPNSGLITANVDNMGQREFRRLSCKLAIAYDTPPDRIDAFCEGIREIVRLHPYMRKDNFHVYFNEMGAASLNILVYVFWKVPNWATELRERHRFLLDCLRLAKRLGVEYAFPTQTLHLIDTKAGPPDTEEGEFSPASSDAAKRRGLAEARSIVARTTGLDVVPPPVILGEKVGGNDGE